MGRFASTRAALAARISAGPDNSPEARVRSGYLRTLLRQPDAQELADGVAFVQSQSDSYAAQGKPDAGMLGLTDFCQVLLTLNEFVFVE